MKKALIVVAGLLLAASAYASDTTTNRAAIEHGKFLVEYGGCHECHTPGWAAHHGEAPTEMLLIGGGMNFQGPWGTTYPPNLRLLVRKLTAEQWTARLRTLKTRPPMPWWAFRYLSDKDLADMYAYIRSLGPAGKPAHDWIPPGKPASPPYFKLIVPQAPASAGTAH